MGDSFFAPPGFPELPTDPPTPPPNFEQIGEGLWAGAAKTGIVSGFLAPLFDILMRWTVVGLGTVLKLGISIFAWIITKLGDVTDEASSAYGKLVAATLHELFGVTVDPSTVNTRVGGPNRQQVANQLGQAVLGTMFKTAQVNPGGGVTPSDAAANQYLAVTMNMELNGWIESWFTDAVSYHLLEKYGDLKDGIARVLGLGRMSRQVFRAPLKVLVSDPYLALLNQKYRPKHVDPNTAIRAYNRGSLGTALPGSGSGSTPGESASNYPLDRDWLSKVLGDQGYSELEIDLLIDDHDKVLSMADVDYLLQRQAWTTQNAVDYLKAQGYDSANAQQVVAILNDKRTQKYREEMAQIARQAYVRGDLDFTSYQQIVGTLNLPAEEAQWLQNVASFERSVHVTHLTQGEIQQGILDGILNLNDLQRWGARVNMPADELAHLELMVLFKQSKESASAKAKAAAATAKATAAKEKADAAAAKAKAAKAAAADKGLSASQAETLVEDGLWTFLQLENFLTANGYGPDAVASIVALLQRKMSAAAAKAGAAAGVRSSAAARGLSLAEVEKAVVAGDLTIDDLRKWLKNFGYDDADAQVIVDLTTDAVHAANVKAAAKEAATLKAADKQISLPELERAVRLGLTSLDAYNAALGAAGFDSAAVALLDGILNAQIASDKATAAKKGASAAAAGQKGASLLQIEQEVVAGIRPIADYKAALAGMGFTGSDQVQLAELVQIKLDQAAATKARREAAGQQLTNRGISLTQAENAVKLGIVPIGTYQAMLKAAGYTQDAIDVLSHSLLAQVAKTTKAQQTANGAAGALAQKSISLPDLERAVVAGIQPIGAYTATLQTAGYSAGDVATLTELLQTKLDVAQRAAAAHADAQGQATQRGISLATEETAVVKGELSMADYDALLNSLGYDDIDRAVLEQLLQAKVDAAAAKA